MQKEKSCYLVSDALISTSRDPSEKTDRFVKTLSALFGAPVLRRGKDSIGEMAYTAKHDGFKSLILAHNVRKYNFSKILFYKLVNNYYKKMGEFKYILSHFTEIHKPYDAIRLSLQTQDKVGVSLFNFLRKCLISYSPSEFRGGSLNVTVRNVIPAFITQSETLKNQKVAILTVRKGEKQVLILRGYVIEDKRENKS